MGTRSLTFVHEADGTPILGIYTQYDGYFSGIGDKILNFLRPATVVNGIGGGPDTAMFNGAGDLGVRLLVHLKDGDANKAGNTYIIPADTVDDAMGAEYVYRIYVETGKPPVLKATAVYSEYTVEGPVDVFAWPAQDEDGNYIPGPMTSAQRKALFALWSDCFGRGENQHDRHMFTTAVLGVGTDPSWSDAGSLTTEDAKRLLSVLGVVKSLL